MWLSNTDRSPLSRNPYSVRGFSLASQITLFQLQIRARVGTLAWHIEDPPIHPMLLMSSVNCPDKTQTYKQ
jgi:hypothetical protein